jgi:hypothetical protein
MRNMGKIYIQEVLINGSKKYFYICKNKLDILEEESILSFTSREGFYIYVCNKEIKNINYTKLPDEQSILSFFPFSLLYGSEGEKVLTLVSDYAKILRGYQSRVLCFHKDCKKRANYYVVSREGLDGGCWYACSKEHFNNKTSRGLRVNIEDYLPYYNEEIP